MAGRSLHGVSASPGVALGTAWVRSEALRGAAVVAWEDQERERDAALSALAAAAQELHELAGALPPEDAAIVEAGVLMAQDPALVQAVEEAVLRRGLPAAEAVRSAAEKHADAIAALGDPTLAARADDVRSLGRRAARLSGGEGVSAPPGTDLILIADDLGPADVAELAKALAGVALAGGGATAHAAIVARSLGIPMVTGLPPELTTIRDGTQLMIDGTAGELIVDPRAEQRRLAAEATHARRIAAAQADEQRQRPAVTRDGRELRVLANIASVAELELALRAGAEGIGLLRTELAFLDASEWPDERAHTEALAPIMAALDRHPAVVRVLDFGADKCPPFLDGSSQRGIELLLATPDALLRQLRAILVAAVGRDVRILLPLVDHPEQLAATRELLERAAAQLAIDPIPPLGAMIETPRAAENAVGLAAGAEFLSIGTNDLTASTLGADRFAENSARAHHPAVLRSIARSVEAAHAAGITIEVCGEAASDAVTFPLLLGLGVDEVSVGAARVGTVRQWARDLSFVRAQEVARAALELDSTESVELAVAPLVRELSSVERGNGLRERSNSGVRVRALRS